MQENETKILDHEGIRIKGSLSMVNQLSYVILKQYLLGLQLEHSPKILHEFYLALHIIRSWILDVTYSPLYTC